MTNTKSPVAPNAEMTDAAQAVPPLALWGGIECTINRVGDRYLDQAALSGHNARADDLDRFAALGIRALRYPLLWETFSNATDPERLWAWHDVRLDRLRQHGVHPILGLVHHGSGPPETNLLSPDFVDGLKDHARRAIHRYPWIRDWTPVNEPLTTARFSTLYGHWYPHLRDERAFWSGLLVQIEATRAAMSEIRRIKPDARLIQTEDLGRTASTPELAGQAQFDNQRRWASWDLLTGRLTADHPLWGRLIEMGFENRLAPLAVQPCVPDMLGLNHYLTSDRFLDHRLDLHPVSTHGGSPFGPFADVEAVRACEHPPGLERALRECWARYQIPIACTEVHNGCTREEQMRWLAEAWEISTRLRGEGVAIHAVTVWSLLGAYDWDSLLIRADGRYESGVFDVRSATPRETALAPMIRQLAASEMPDHPMLANGGWWRRHESIVRGDGHHGDPSPIMITGATGTLGQAFAGACRLRGIAHVLTARNMVHLNDSGSITRALDELRPWAVINCAGWVRVDEAETQVDDCMAANFTGNIALADACARRAIHYTCFSSDLVFDGLTDRAYVESDVTTPMNVYGLSKARADYALQQAGHALIIRTASFFSPYDQHNFAVHLVAALREGRPFPAVADWVTSPTYIPDLVRATLDLIIDDEVGLWHLTNDGATSWADFAMAVGERLELNIGLIDAKPLSAMGWAAKRPPYAPITSQRGLVMPSLISAIERFGGEVTRLQ